MKTWPRRLVVLCALLVDCGSIRFFRFMGLPCQDGVGLRVPRGT